MTLPAPPAALSACFVLVLVSAASFVCAFPPLHLRALAWLALVPLMLAIRHAPSPGAAIALAGLWGMLAAAGTTDWLPPTLALYYGQPFWLGLALFLIAAFLMGAVEYMAFAACYRLAASLQVRPLVLVAGAAWALAELGRDRVLTGNPWGLLGYTQMPLSPAASMLPASWLAERVVQVADIGGVYCVSFVIAMVNAAIVEAWVVPCGERASAESTATASGWRRAVVIETLTAAAISVLVLAYGSVRLGQDWRDESAAESVRVGIAQANLDLGARWDPSLYGRNLDSYLKLTHEMLQQGAIDLVVWPENAMTFFVADEPSYRHAIASVTGPAGVELLAGAPRIEQAARPRFYNSAFLLAADGSVLGTYDKEHLLPFAEYFPFGSVEILRRTFGRVREFSTGTATSPLATVLGPTGVLICNEAMFPHLARDRVRSGAAVLVNLSNDSWVASTEFAEHQFALVSMRAIETRRHLIRASTSGPSALIGPTGRVMARTAPFTSGALAADVVPMRAMTLYAHVGDFFCAACAVFLAAAFVRAWQHRSGRG
ncbi:MAG TPA: apolipoprotein N-acyltransferase [Candidatus Binatia bacterium]|nr:apolipoprotein N-acyltransferase [Candidatus Binatia bacterium]